MKLGTMSAIFALAASTCLAQAEEWTAYTYSSVSTTAAVKGMNRIAERVAEETGSDLTIELHLGKTLQIASSDITQAVGDGVVDFAADFFFSGNVPLARVLNLPMLIENDEEWAKAYAAMEPALVEAFGEQGVVLLGGYRYPEQTIFTTFEIDGLDDLNGHKIRVTSPEQGKFIEVSDADVKGKGHHRVINRRRHRDRHTAPYAALHAIHVGDEVNGSLALADNLAGLYPGRVANAACPDARLTLVRR